MFKNEFGRCLEKGQKSGSGDLNMIYRVSQKSQNKFTTAQFLRPKCLKHPVVYHKMLQ